MMNIEITRQSIIFRGMTDKELAKALERLSATDNVVMQNPLHQLGFTQCGIIHVVEDNYPRYAYERL